MIICLSFGSNQGNTAGFIAYQIDDKTDIPLDWLLGIEVVEPIAGASIRKELMEKVLHYLNGAGCPKVETIRSIVEDLEFALP